MDTFKDKLPSTFDIQIGYLTKKGNSKRWIEKEADQCTVSLSVVTPSLSFVTENRMTYHAGNGRKRKRTTKSR